MPSTRTLVRRTIAADPTSTALLLAGPAALELWPGVRRVGSAGGRALVETELPAPRREPVGRTTAATVRAQPPRRTPTAFVTRFAWSGPDLPGTRGELRLTYATGGAEPRTVAELVLDSEGVEDSGLDGAVLHTMASDFLDNLAEAAEQRRDAG